MRFLFSLQGLVLGLVLATLTTTAFADDERYEVTRLRARDITLHEAHITFMPDGGCLFWVSASGATERGGYVVGTTGVEFYPLGLGEPRQVRTEPAPLGPARCNGVRSDATARAYKALIDGGAP